MVYNVSKPVRPGSKIAAVGGQKRGDAPLKGKSKWLWSHRTLANLFVVLVGIAF